MHTLIADDKLSARQGLKALLTMMPRVETDFITGYIPANDIADEWGTTKMLNMATLGALLAKRPDLLSLEVVEQALSDHLPATKAHLIDGNRQVLQQGYQSVGDVYRVSHHP